MLHHNKYTKLTYWLLGLGSCLGLVFLWALALMFASGQPLFIWGLAIVLTLMLGINSYFAYQIYRKNFKVLKWVMWLYAFQIIGFETENWAYSFSFGLQLNVSLPLGSAKVVINLFSILILFVVYKAIKGIQATQPLVYTEKCRD